MDLQGEAMRSGGRSSWSVRLAHVLVVCAALLAFAAAGSARAATVRSHAVGPQTKVTIQLTRHVKLVVPKHTVARRGRITVVLLPRHAVSVRISVPWRQRIRVVAHAHGRTQSALLGGILFTKSAGGASRSAHAALNLNPLGNVCVKLALAVGAAAIGTGPLDLGIDGATVTGCLIRQGLTHLGRAVLSRIASALGHDCAAALLKSGINDVTFFRVPECNRPKGPTGPSNGTPLVIATLPNNPVQGIPLSPPSVPSPTPHPAPTTPAPAPASPRLSPGEFSVMNADGGIFWRSAPDWNAAVAVAGNGFYPGTVIRISCFQSGTGNVPGSANSMWEQASWVGGPGRGSGWINEHFINDGVAINQPTPGVPPCAVAAPPPAAQTWPETVGGVAHTWTNYTNAGGTEGPSIGAGQTVAIACKLQGFRVADGNTWWYRIASPPWNGNFHVSADAFYNNGATSGSLHGTPFVDPAVRDC
ncbi:hypothetical protein Q5424_18840 [Conexibacter sp. JD483]|uniref:hypothetical protein n=1 Tax=unclassified Conexibacter TaxID=2627773 RepID=UPI0027219D0E|nr:MULTISPECIES: hypothetical protein [unclassified Conexibacter]MDO8188748.1 hypothetical protein [Conexibacter sp. CPCC 205706]MDO8199900.1 hypothetical protein [Conexibacter sp. CPCC 205762]MDR9371161.1 hypothetical protein [Conexibacter sp. JD483]